MLLSPRTDSRCHDFRPVVTPSQWLPPRAQRLRACDAYDFGGFLGNVEQGLLHPGAAVPGDIKTRLDLAVSRPSLDSTIVKKALGWPAKGLTALSVEPEGFPVLKQTLSCEFGRIPSSTIFGGANAFHSSNNDLGSGGKACEGDLRSPYEKASPYLRSLSLHVLGPRWPSFLRSSLIANQTLADIVHARLNVDSNSCDRFFNRIDRYTKCLVDWLVFCAPTALAIVVSSQLSTVPASASLLFPTSFSIASHTTPQTHLHDAHTSIHSASHLVAPHDVAIDHSARHSAASDSVPHTDMPTRLVGHSASVYSLASSTFFIASIHGFSKHETAMEGNLMGMLATAFGIISVATNPSFGSKLVFCTTFISAGCVGLGIAQRVTMEEMPQLVAGFHSFVGLAAVFCGLSNYLHSDQYECLKAIETFLGMGVGMLTFTGSFVASGKLHELIPGRPIILPCRWGMNYAALLASGILLAAYTRSSVFLSSSGVGVLLLNTFIWGGLGANLVLPIGGADMPVVISLLNAFSGVATSASGFLLNNSLLTITGAIVASSGTMLSDIMCKGINRSMFNVLSGGFGTDGGQIAHGGSEYTGIVQEVNAQAFVNLLIKAKRVVIVPGYGMAVARCQSRVAAIVALLRSHGKVVHFAIHPVAGRLPGHMNVLLAEANVPYDIVKEMEDINKDIGKYDVAVVVGANDTVNPATQDDPNSPIYGMPAVEVWEAKICVVLKRSLATGYSGVDNPLFYKSNVRMFFGDAGPSLDSVFSLLGQQQAEIKKDVVVAEEGVVTSAHNEADYPPPKQVIGILKERKAGEQRVTLAPVALPRLRKIGFSILLESGAGIGAGYTDEDYLAYGGVQVVKGSSAVLQFADFVLTVNDPLPDQVEALTRAEQTMIGFWAMYGKDSILPYFGKSPATFCNLALVPRVSRAQKLDALTSMANIAGYRAVIEAFMRLPRFSRSSVTASGTVPPAKVFVIGAGIAGLSAIATAHALGAKVFANDVREAAREQVEGMGATFVPVDAVGIAGEGIGGYATEVGEEFTRAQLETYARIVPDVDIVITTALIPNRAAPMLITREMIARMKKGSVIVDLSASAGGNCALTTPDHVVNHNGIIIIGETNYASQMAGVASEMLGFNFVALLEVLGGADIAAQNWDDPVIKPTIVSRATEVFWPPLRPPSTPPAAVAPSSRHSPTLRPQLPASQSMSREYRELAIGVGAAVVLGLGLHGGIPDEVLGQLGQLVLALIIGNFTVASVTPALHTPLISVTNAISGIIVIGGMLQLDGPLSSPRVACAIAAVFLSSVNIVGGFAVTNRMLQMFQLDTKH